MTFKIILVLLGLSVLISPVFADDTEKVVDEWLVLGPVGVLPPVFEEEDSSLKDALKFNLVDASGFWPGDGQKLSSHPNTDLTWDKFETKNSMLTIEPKDGDNKTLQTAYCGFYINTDQWIKADIRITSAFPFEIYFDGKKIGEKTFYKSTILDSANQLKKEVTVETGKHLVVVKSVFQNGNETPWQISAKITSGSDHFDLTTNSVRPVAMRHILDRPGVNDIKISADGKYLAISLSQRNINADRNESWIEIFDVKQERLIKSYRGQATLSSFEWSPLGNKFAFTSVKDEKSTLWISDIKTGSSQPLLTEIENFGDFSWAPDASYLIYSITRKPEENKTGLKKLKGMPDHWPQYRNKSYWFKISYPEGIKTRLTAGPESHDIMDISPDGRKLLLFRTTYEYDNRPYYNGTLLMLDIATMGIDSLWKGYWLSSAQFSPDGNKLLCLGAPSLFDGSGINLPEGMIPNDYDGQAYIFDIASREVEAISWDFDPAISNAYWKDDKIYLIAANQDYRSVYSYTPDSKRYKKMDTGIDVVRKLSLAKTGPVAVVSGTSVTTPDQVAVINLKNDHSRLILEPAKAFFKDTQTGKVESWKFDSKYGRPIDGRIYYPPGFSPEKKYPCIVYYYGGTSPITRDFGGRYPKNYYAANGYVVYVINPSGATGYGQEFSALHVNDWGKIAGDQIIEGTKKFLAAHSFVDPDRVGCIGASYGGFMTMYLVAKTDIFSAAISHAGISSLSSYWGEGYWGYLYSAIATANSFPWNRPDVYIDQSPLFLADSINTPLLLLHGADDTNVPPGESRQLYTALKLLKKDVELIEISGQNHWILDYDKRVRWTKTIIAWFDRNLKDQSGWWDNLYPDN